jgi:Glycosyltransferase family 87
MALDRRRGAVERYTPAYARIAALPGFRTLRSARFRLAVAIVLLVDALVGYGLNSYLAFEGWRTHGDIRQNLQAAKLLLQGRSVYAPLPPAPPDTVLVNPLHILYPPSHFVLVMPWAVMSDLWWRLTWIGLNQAALVVLVVALLAGVRGAGRTEKILVVALILSFDPLRIGIEQGQTQLMVTALVVLAALGLQRGRPVAGGLALGLAIALKVNALPVAVFFLWRRGYRLLAAAAATCGAVFLITVFAGWWPHWLEWLRLMGPVNRGSAMVINQSVNGFWLRILQPDLSGQPISPPATAVQLLVLATQLVLASAVAYLVVRVRAPEPERFWIQLSLVLIAVPMLQAYGLDHHYTAAVVAIPAVLRLAARRLLPLPALFGLATGWILVVVSDPVIYSLAHSLPSSGWAHRAGPLAASSMLLYAMLVILVTLGMGTRGAPASRAGTA